MSKKKKFDMSVGIDVSQRTLAVAWRGVDGEVHEGEFANDGDGHQKLVRMLRAGRRTVRVVLEATGNYSVDVAIALHDAKVDVMIANPLATRRFSDAQLRRAKTDKVDARDLLSFTERMEFTAWKRPSDAALHMRDFSRRIYALGVEKTAADNQLHAAKAKHGTPPVIVADLEASIASLKARIEALTTAAVAHASADAGLAPALQTLMTVKGIAERSAARILGELVLLPADMTPDQVVAHAGLDPRTMESGTSIRRTSRISKVGNARLRAALYMPTLVAVQHEPAVKVAYDAMLARKKVKLVAQTAMMRRLLRVLWRMLRTNSAFNADKFSTRPANIPAVAA